MRFVFEERQWARDEVQIKSTQFGSTYSPACAIFATQISVLFQW